MTNRWVAVLFAIAGFGCSAVNGRSAVHDKPSQDAAGGSGGSVGVEEGGGGGSSEATGAGGSGGSGGAGDGGGPVEPACSDGVVNPGELCLSVALGADAPGAIAGNQPRDVVFIDCDQMGWADIAVADKNHKVVALVEHLGALWLEAKEHIVFGAAPVRLAVGNVGADTAADLLLGRAGSGYAGFLPLVADSKQNCGFSAGAADYVQYNALDVAVGDINYDGLGDSIAMMAGTVYWSAHGSSSPIALEKIGTTGNGRVVAGHLNSDVYPEILYLTDSKGGLLVVHDNNIEDGLSYSPTLQLPTGVKKPLLIAVADLDKDNKGDAIAAFKSGYGWALNQGNMNLGDKLTFEPHADLVDVEVADMDGDGDRDIVLLDASGKITILLNDSTPGNVVLNKGLEIMVDSGAVAMDVAALEKGHPPSIVVVHDNGNAPGTLTLVLATP